MGVSDGAQAGNRTPTLVTEETARLMGGRVWAKHGRLAQDPRAASNVELLSFRTESQRTPNAYNLEPALQRRPPGRSQL